jgi:hypothetical protein
MTRNVIGLRLFLLHILLSVCWAGAFGQAAKNGDEAAFRKSLRNFKAAVAGRDVGKAEALMNFPFFTSRSSIGSGRDLPVDPISRKEFQTYKSDIFNAEVIRVLPRLNESSVAEMEGNEDTYDAALRSMADPGSKLYEVYAQYEQKGRNTESFFAFVFARVKARYRVVAYYGKWPVTIAYD